MFNNLKQYPSGFLGNPNIDQTQNTNNEQTTKMINVILSRAHHPSKDSQFTASKEIIDIWDTVLSTPEEADTFEFKERILKLAIKAFGTNNFSEWVYTQSKNPNFTLLHQKFIDDTINYIYFNKNRQYTNNNWMTLLDDSKTGEKVDSLSELQKEFFKGLNHHKDNSNMTSLTIKELISDWVKKDGGIEDLTAALFVLFGDR